MCGIIATPGHHDLSAGLAALAHRGPDGTGVAEHAQVTLGHARLAIQDPTEASAQPYRDGPVVIAYNGELFNAAQVRAVVQAADPARVWATTGDTEVVAAALSTVGPGRALPLLDGMFALAWGDERDPGVLNLARDRGGEIPLHLHRAAPVMAASELKAFTAAGRACGKAVVDVPAGQWWRLTSHGTVSRHKFHELANGPEPTADLDEAGALLGTALAGAADRRAVSDVPVCTLLSGGIDSAVIALELKRFYPDLVCYTAVLDPGSRDLRCAREVADMLGVKLAEVPVPVPTADDLAVTVARVELPFKAQVEIAWPCLHLAAVMRGDGFKVTYSGEGSDELWASYGFAFHGLARAGWHEYRRRLIADQARKNFPRVNKSFMAYGVEARLPFLDPAVVDLALSLPRSAVADSSRPKAVLEQAYAGRLPASVLTRPKAAFQDAMGLKAAIGRVVADPARFYAAEYRRSYG